MIRKQFTSSLSQEMKRHLEQMSKMGKFTDKARSVLLGLDEHLTSIGLKEKVLTAKTIADYLGTKVLSDSARECYTSDIRGFAKFLSSIGIQVDCPAYPVRRTPKKYKFASVLSKELDDYLRLMAEIGRSMDNLTSVMRSIDRYLVSINHDQKSLPAEVVSDWLKTLDIGAATRFNYTSKAKGFAKFLISIGVDASYPEHPIWHSEYIPHIFSESEVERIFHVADNFLGAERMTRTSLFFPIMLRLLYGCGLRVEECIVLRWDDIDDDGVITIKHAKNSKQRFVPMDATLTETLESYRQMVSHYKICSEYLFESNIKRGHPFRKATFQQWFAKILDKAGVERKSPSKRTRGISTHCLRYTFVHYSFLKNGDSHRQFEGFAPYLSAYLGHEDLRGTESYLSTNHSMYKKSHQRVSEAIGGLFPEVCFTEE